MKAIKIILISIFVASSAIAAPTNKSYSFQFKSPKAKPFAITQKASSKEEAYKLAAKECFKKLTNNIYPGEQKGLEIIDICANPKM